ncbi:MAG: hypothetical protein DI537_19185 [Stutzerimonas stutzeri]|nr:MAG: hypothetical protein DI537_19185 [Stutzerimonas stutzeri]
MWGLRRHVSLLLAHGHADAQCYPVRMVWEEGFLVVERINQMLATETALMHQVITTGISAFGKDGGKSAHASLMKSLKRLTGDGSK